MEAVGAPVLIARGMGFAEGVNFDRDGTLYCVDIPNGNVCRLRPGGALEVWVHTGGGPNGTRFGPGGDLFVADCDRHVVLRLAARTGAETVYAASCDGQPFNGPNDLCFGPDGTLYFTDPFGSSLENRVGAVYAVAPGGAVARVAGGLAFPNGVMVTPDGAALVVGETHTGLLRRYSLDPARPYEELAPLATLSPSSPPPDEAGPDGFAYGADGNLYVAHYGSGFVQVIAPGGALLASLPAGGPTPTNVAFWQDSLYVTEGNSGSLYRLDVGVREQPTFMRPW